MVLQLDTLFLAMPSRGGELLLNMLAVCTGSMTET